MFPSLFRFLILVMMSKTKIHSCFNKLIIYMYIKITLPLGHGLNASDCAGIVSGPDVMSNHKCFVDFLQYLFHLAMLRMDAATIWSTSSIYDNSP